MKFIVVVLVIKFIITMFDGKNKKEEKITVTKNVVHDPAAFQLR